MNGQESDVIGYQCNIDGIPMVTTSEPRGPTFHYDRPSVDSFGDQPHIQDPLDKKYVNLEISQAFPNATVNQGAFAARDVPMGTIYCLYGGLILTKSENEALNHVIYKSNDSQWIEKQNMYR